MQNAIASLKQGLWWIWKHKVRAVILLLVFSLLAPGSVRSQFLDPCCAILATGLSTISSTLSSVIGGGLNSILSVEKNISSFEQTVVWPQKLIAQAQSLVGNVQGIFNQIQGVMRVPVNSASLPATQQVHHAGGPSRRQGKPARESRTRNAAGWRWPDRECHASKVQRRS